MIPDGAQMPTTNAGREMLADLWEPAEEGEGWRRAILEVEAQAQAFWWDAMNKWRERAEAADQAIADARRMSILDHARAHIDLEAERARLRRVLRQIARECGSAPDMIAEGQSLTDIEGWALAALGSDDDGPDWDLLKPHAGTRTGAMAADVLASGPDGIVASVETAVRDTPAAKRAAVRTHLERDASIEQMASDGVYYGSVLKGIAFDRSVSSLANARAVARAAIETAR